MLPQFEKGLYVTSFKYQEYFLTPENKSLRCLFEVVICKEKMNICPIEFVSFPNVSFQPH